MATPPASIPEHWMMCHTARRFRAAVFADVPTGGLQEDTLMMRKTVERADGVAAEGEWCVL
jgi:acid phosphatase